MTMPMMPNAAASSSAGISGDGPEITMEVGPSAPPIMPAYSSSARREAFECSNGTTPIKVIMSDKASSTEPVIIRVLRRRAAVRASSAFMSSSFLAINESASGSHEGTSSSPSRPFTDVSSACAKHISSSASGTDSPFSYLDIVWRTTLSRTASSSWEIPLALRSDFIFSLSIEQPPFTDDSTPDRRLWQAMHIYIAVAAEGQACILPL